jgi:tRNA pseudouridine65 synthase
MTTMMLHAQEITFNHPATGEKITIEAEISDEFKRVKEFLGII